MLWLMSGTFLSGCTGTRHLEGGDRFYTGADIEIESTDKVSHRKTLLTTLEQVLHPEPNEKLLGSRPKVWFYHLAGTPSKEKGLKHWIKNKLGHPPVLMDQADPEHTRILLLNRLHNRGYFDATLKYEIILKKKSAHINYLAKVNEPYRIKKLYYPPKVGALRTSIDAIMETTLIKSGDPYNLNILLKERKRIDDELKNRGFYFFSPDYLSFKADSTAGKREVDLYLSVKDDIPLIAARPQRINTIRIDPDYDISDPSSDGPQIIANNFKDKNYRFVFEKPKFKPQVIIKSIYLRKGILYDAMDHQATINRLMGLGAFKFINVRFQEDSILNNNLNAEIQLTPMLKKSLRFEADLVAGSNNFIGPEISINYCNRNSLQGAELFIISLNGGFETQVSGQGQPSNSFEFGIQTGLYIPRYISPIKIRARPGFPPQTVFEIGYSYLHRPQFFTLNSFRLSYGNRKHRHRLSPIEINLVKPLNTTKEFDELLVNNDFLKQSYEEQFILGGSYTYRYTSPFTTPGQIRFSGNVELSGNMINAAQRISSKSEGPNEVLGQIYSQYTRLEAEWRYLYGFGKSNRLAARLLLGSGFHMATP